MNVNTLLLFLLVIAAYLNLYLTHKRLRKRKKRTQLPISSKEWSEKVKDNSLKELLKNRERLNK